MDDDIEMAEAVPADDDEEYQATAIESKKDDDYLMSGISKTSGEKARITAIFWEKVWPMLADIGWTKVRTLATQTTMGQKITLISSGQFP